MEKKEKPGFKLWPRPRPLPVAVYKMINMNPQKELKMPPSF